MNRDFFLKYFFLVKNYVLILISLFLSWLVSFGVMSLLASPLFLQAENSELIPLFLGMVIVFALGFIAYELAKPTVLPSFVIAIFFGFANQDVLAFITDNSTALTMLTTIGATLILFGGGLETPFTRFRILLKPIISIAFFGTVLTAFLFSIFFAFVGNLFGFEIPLAALVLLGSALASTDPAAIIPSLRSLSFFQPKVKHLAISESALNDVIGALITGIFLVIFLNGEAPASIVGIYAGLFNMETFVEIMKIVVVGSLVGYAGYAILNRWSEWKERIISDGEADAALFLAVPLLTFAMASLFGGNGFLAVFVAGLLFQLKSHVHHVENFFNHTVEGFMKPLIFMLLGTLVNFGDLQQYALLGIVMALIFMFVLRPVVVFLTLSPFSFGTDRFTVKELVFLSFVRETGVIPAVLLVGIKLAGIPGSEIALAVGMWVILLTLILQPPFTPLLAKRLKLAKDLTAFPLSSQTGPTAVLCSRSYTFLKRLDQVVDWALKYKVRNVLLLHCPEHKYSVNFLAEVKKVAERHFRVVNKEIIEDGHEELNFQFLGRAGKLERNIELLLDNNDISIIFVGSKMLDYRLEKIKKMKVPFVFID